MLRLTLPSVGELVRSRDPVGRRLEIRTVTVVPLTVPFFPYLERDTYIDP